MVAARKQTEFVNGQRICVTRDLPHKDFPLVIGDTGIVVFDGAQYGIAFDRYGKGLFYVRKVGGRDRDILDFCQPVLSQAKPVDVLMKLYDVKITPEQQAEWQHVEAVAADFIEKKLAWEQAKSAAEKFTSETPLPAFPPKIEDWREYHVISTRRNQWHNRFASLEIERDTAEREFWNARDNLYELLPICEIWFRFGNLGIRADDEGGIECRSWSEVE